ncbi:MAG: hypothetical protein LH479_12825, partial [Polaromonas sp.]|nr:hypothetical protein [Polaromonas sp.]
LGQGSPLLEQYFARSGMRFLRRHSPVPTIAIAIMLGKMLFKRLLMGDWARAKAVLAGFRQA